MELRNKNMSLTGLLLVGILSFSYTLFHADGEHSEYLSDCRVVAEGEDLPMGYNSLFAASGECAICHGPDSLGIASVDTEGNDINLVDRWRSSMMANSAKDPFWRAKVSHEVELFPELQGEIESSCTDCHAPLGFFNAHHQGQEGYSIAEMEESPLALDGVSCLACHQQSDENLATQFSGQMTIDTNQVAYGPFGSPLVSPMAQESGWEPVHSEHISDAGICGACHTLQTQSVDADGNLLDNMFVEQATYHEWLNSKYNEENITCQNCHMPTLGKQEVFLAAGYDTEARAPFSQHEFAGANAQMLKILKNNIESLGLTASTEDFDRSIEAVNNMMTYNTLDLNLEMVNRNADSAFFQVKLHNKAGHKFPSGYPSRRATVQFILENDLGDTLFYSGKFDDDYALIDEDFPQEPHYDIISSDDQVQIYELVMNNSDGEFTTILLRAFEPGKDNRLVPEGFSTAHSTYDTTFMAGLVVNDLNFNYEDGEEGSGTDIIHYNIPLNGYTGSATVRAKVVYQTLHPKWMEEMFATETPEIELFEQMYDEADLTPVPVADALLEVGEYVGIESIEQITPWIQVTEFSMTGFVDIIAQKKSRVSVYDSKGSLLYESELAVGKQTLDLNNYQGQIILSFVSEENELFSKRIIILNK